MAKITITCLELITVICVVQTIQLIATSRMHDPSYASINGIRYAVSYLTFQISTI
jgi:hypothetical protein